jgi:hypothetical protein
MLLLLLLLLLLQELLYRLHLTVLQDWLQLQLQTSGCAAFVHVQSDSPHSEMQGVRERVTLLSLSLQLLYCITTTAKDIALLEQAQQHRVILAVSMVL